MGVLDDASARLYAGALLGKSLIKDLGEADSEGLSRTLATRRATLQAGVASGKIKPEELSKQDAGLLGGVLEGKEKIPTSPFGFVGHFFGNLAKGAGEFGDSLLHLPQGIEALGEAGASSLEKAKGNPFMAAFEAGEGKNQEGQIIGQTAQGVAHDFSSPRQIYEHPFNPLMDVASAFTGGAGLASKTAGTLSRAGAFGEELSGVDEAGNATKLGRFAPLAKRAIGLTSTLGRPDVSVSPAFTDANADLLDEAGVKAAKVPRAYSPNVGMKYFVQKPLDTAISKLKDLSVPGGSGTIGDLQGGLYGRKIINRTRAQIAAGTNEGLLNSPINDMFHSAQRLFNHGQGAGVYQSFATFLHSVGVNTLDKLDEYANQLREGVDVDGETLTPEEQAHAGEIIKRSEDPRFRQLIEHPTNEMKDYAYQIRRSNVHLAQHLDIDPLTSEDAAFGRLRALTGKTNEELRGDLPPELHPQNKFAKGLQALQEAISGQGTVEQVPSVKELAFEIPFGSIMQKESLMRRVVESMKADLEKNESQFDRQRDVNYIPGNNLFEKVATGLHDELGVDQEQAASFARGVALGTPEGPILPTYMPSISGQGLHYGLRRDPLRQRVGRVLGLSKFQPIEGIEKQPDYYELRRPFSPRTASAQTIGLGPAKNYLKEANYESFLKGAMQASPEAIAKNAYQIQRDLITQKLNPAMIERLAVKGTDGDVMYFRGPGEMQQALGVTANHYSFVPVDTWKNYIATKSGLEMDFAHILADKGVEGDLEAEIENLADESAQEFISNESAKAAGGNNRGVALPTTFVKTIVEHVRVTESQGVVGRINGMVLGRWKSAVLSMMPSWLLRTSLGHGILALIDGTVNPKFWMAAHRYFDDRPVLPEQLETLKNWRGAGDAVLGTTRDIVPHAALQPGDLPAGVNQGGMMHELADIGQGAREAKQFAPTRFISGGVHVTTNYQRRAIFLRGLEREAKQRLAELGKDFEHPGNFWDIRNIDAVLDPAFRETVLKSPDLVEHAFDQLGKVSYTFGEMSPWERRLVKNSFPFYGWYKFISKFVWSMPVNYPGRTAAIAALGHVGQEETDKMGALPDYLEGALFFNHGDLTNSKYINLYGLNPLGNFGNPFSPKGALEGVASAGELSPLIQSLIAATGVNPMTMEPESIDPFSGVEQGKYGEWLNTKTGQALPNIGAVNPIQRGLGTFLRAFPELRAAELLRTGGNPVYPESIPFVDEHPVGVNPETRRGYNLPSILEQEIGIQPRTYNISKHTAELLSHIAEAKKANERAQARTREKLALPNP